MGPLPMWCVVVVGGLKKLGPPADSTTTPPTLLFSPLALSGDSEVAEGLR
jgi:hypothetical protein